MTLRRVLHAVFANIRRNRRSFVLSSIGLVIGVATLTFFVHLGLGVQVGVLNRIYPVNQIEVEPKTVGIVGLREDVVDTARLGGEIVKDLSALPDVTAVYPKLRSKFQARLWGGEALFGYAARTEAFFDGLDARLIAEELASSERVEEKRRRKALRKPEACKNDDECRLGEACDAASQTCGDIEYWRRFADHGMGLYCQSDAECPDEMACVLAPDGGAGAPRSGRCEVACDSAKACPDGGVCEAGACRRPCASDAECRGGEACEPSAAGAKVCHRLTCTLETPEDQLLEDPMKAKGRLLTRCGNGVAPGSANCEPMTCPGSSYCAPRSLLFADGVCEEPVPVVLSPTLIELFNNAAANSLGMRKLDGLGAMLGVRFQLHMGDSYFAADLPKEKQATKRAEIVGFSQKAMDFGVTMPLAYVEALNARYKGRAAAHTFDTFILETRGNEDVSALIARVGEFGLSLARRSQDAQKAGDLLFILTVVFSFISMVILFVAGVNIMHTFLTLVTERRHEIGIMRAIGATRGDIRRLFLTEALMLGIFGGALGNLVSYGVTRLANWIGQTYLSGIPFKPDEFFAYDWRVVLGGIAFACVFCLLGAFIPARRAAKLDPAVVLSS
ncbi:MAG: FtsX-like permease family protein [Deltaproteobacteria bacterium]|nr:FtsX-like permease family protein [Deltaproteobacteria bacterium]